jgi:hypothetical protein
MNNLDAVREIIGDVLCPGHFFAGPSLRMEWEHAAHEETPWEIFRGRLAPRHVSRETAIFESWNIFLWQDGERSGEPLLSLKLDVERWQLHIVRGLLCWTWEGYDAGGNVYESREVQRWLRELIGSIDLPFDRNESLPYHVQESLRVEVVSWLAVAMTGLSRLPLTSVEAPLPGFTLGQLAYFYNADRQTRQERPQTSWRELLTNYRDMWSYFEIVSWFALASASWLTNYRDMLAYFEVSTKWLEFLIRVTPQQEVADLASACVRQWQTLELPSVDILGVLRTVFNEIALSPYTDFVDKTLAFLRQLVDLHYVTSTEQVDFLSWLLRQLARHLTAYDLVTFHHRGANYPDALLLDAALKEYLRLLEQQPALFDGDKHPARLRRRALRQAWLHRRRYEGHPVPDAPTSPGENMRVLPSPHQRVPEEQIVHFGKRKKRLYQGDPLPSHVGVHGLRVLQHCGRDLQLAQEVRESGMAVFIERPLALVKVLGEPDLSPLLAHEAFSRSLAERALAELAREPLLGLSTADVAHCRAVLAESWPNGGIAANTLPTEPPRVVALADAAKAANDFVILRTLPASLRDFDIWPDVSAVLQKHGIDLNAPGSRWLVIGSVTAQGKPGVSICDGNGQRLVELEVDAAQRVRVIVSQLQTPPPNLEETAENG